MSRIVVSILCLGLAVSRALSADFEIVINNGRVIDPETNLDAIRHVGIRNGSILAISETPLVGDEEIDASNMVVSPGFIDRNTYSLGDELFRLRAADGVTTTFNFEEGAIDVAQAYESLAGSALINYGFSSSEGAARMKVAFDGDIDVRNGIAYLPDSLSQAKVSEIDAHSMTPEEFLDVLDIVEVGLKAGAPAVGMGPEYFPASTNNEVLEVFKLAAKYGRSVQIHVRSWDPLIDHGAMYEVIAGSVVSGAPIHISHLNSVSAEYIDIYLGFLTRVTALGLPITTECYPYTAGKTEIQSTMFDSWRDWSDEQFDRYQWAATGERLTRTTFEEYREEGGWVIIHWMQEEWIEKCVSHPMTQIASDGGWDDGDAHPRVSGSHTRFLGRYVRDKQLLDLPLAIRKISLLPALSLQQAIPQMARKGRLQVGMDADIVVFDASTVIDKATYESPLSVPDGIKVVMVNGVVILQDGQFVENVWPGESIRAAIIE